MKTAVTREEFEQVAKMLEEGRAKTRPRQYDLFDIFNAILYRDATGCAWRNLPAGFPPWRSVHEYRIQWSRIRSGSKSLLEAAYAKLGIDFTKGDGA